MEEKAPVATTTRVVRTRETVLVYECVYNPVESSRERVELC
jgi:hypothetical protein